MNSGHLQRVAHRLGGLAAYVEKRFRTDGALNMASSLSYTSLLSLVPLLAIGLAILAAFPAFNHVREQLQATVFRYFVPQVGEQVEQYVGAFVANAGKLTTAGVVGLAFSAVMVLVTIETSLNQIFRVVTPRPPMSRLLLYWTVVTLGPLLLGASLSLSAWFFTVSDWATRAGFSTVTQLLTLTAPTLLLVLAFTLLYQTVPNRHVRPADAVAGAVAASLSFALLRWGFGIYLASAHSYQSIYGAVAAVPIFLFWMYLSWAVVLFGAELAAALPEWRLSRPDLGGSLPAHRRLASALVILEALLEEARRGGKGRSRLDLLDCVGEGEGPFLAVLNRLCDEGYVARTAAGRFVLARDLAAVSLADLVHLLDLGLTSSEAADCATPWMGRIAGYLAEAAQAEAQVLDLPLRSLLEEAERRPAPTLTA